MSKQTARCGGGRIKKVFLIDKLTMLKQYFGHAQFRPGQEELIDAILSGRDVLGVMPTGAGKSVCYQLPAMMLPGLTLVISPLISLMKDQVAALEQSQIPAACINSSLSLTEYDEVYRRAEQGAYKLLYVAPERLSTEDFLAFVRGVQVSFVAVDEAHCVSQWGQDFRPSYLGIADFVSQLPERPVLGAFTATATEQVKDDIHKMLGLIDPLRLTTGFDRPNLYFEVMHPKKKEAALLSFLSEHREQTGIVYCATRKAVESVCDKLREQGFAATRYHAGLDDEERRRNQEDFEFDRARVMVATNAFGMGIDKSNVSFVVHYHMPKNIESYYQEAGRAGRDGSPANCLLLFSIGDVQTAKYFIENASENEALDEEERQFVHEQDLRRLEEMVGYCKTSGCLRAYLLRYFGEEAPERCGNCANCVGEWIRQDITVEAQKILSGVVRVEKKYPTGLGLTQIIAMLRGSKNQRVLQLGLDKLSTYGIMHGVDQKQLREYVEFLIDSGYLYLTQGEYPVLRATPQAREVLFHGETVEYSRRVPSVQEKKLPTSRRKKAAAEPVEQVALDPQGQQEAANLFEALRDLRNELSQKQNIPAYLIFTNASLTDMAARQPDTMEEFLQVSGVGEYKAKRYGKVFLDRIAAWKKQHPSD